MQGLHLCAELHGCDPFAPLMRDAEALRRHCHDLTTAAGLHCVGAAFHTFGTPLQDTPATLPKDGVTGVLLLAESHLAIHTWPELGAVTLDIYVCNGRRDHSDAARAVAAQLEAAFAPQRVTRRALNRGELIAQES